jgi:hypothetical protein
MRCLFRHKIKLIWQFQDPTGAIKMQYEHNSNTNGNYLCEENINVKLKRELTCR